MLLPLLIHLLGFGRAPRHRFPTLRFIQSSRLLPTRRTRIHDPWLLLLRAMIVLGAVAALAQPLVQTAERRTSFAASLARVVILDTSVSTQRAALGAGWGADSARVLMRAFADSADVSRVIETADVEAVLSGSVHWLSTQAMKREIVMLSDFQVGVLDSVGVRDVPVDVGVRLVRVGAFDDGGSGATATAMATASGTPLSLTDQASAEVVSAAFEAARSVGALSYSASGATRMERLQSVAIVSSDYPGRDSVVARAVPLQTAWMIRLLHEVTAHRLAADAGKVRAMQGALSGQPLLLFFVSTDVTPAALLPLFTALYDVLPRIDEQGNLLARSAELLELETATLPDSVLRGWQRAPVAEASSLDMQRLVVVETTMPGAPGVLRDAPSDARWLWAVVLVLLGAEAAVRRRLSRAANVESAANAVSASARAA